MTTTTSGPASRQTTASRKNSWCTSSRVPCARCMKCRLLRAARPSNMGALTLLVQHQAHLHSVHQCLSAKTKCQAVTCICTWQAKAQRLAITMYCCLVCVIHMRRYARKLLTCRTTCRQPVFPAKHVLIEVGHSLGTMRPVGSPQPMAAHDGLQRFSVSTDRHGSVAGAQSAERSLQ